MEEDRPEYISLGHKRQYGVPFDRRIGLIFDSTARVAAQKVCFAVFHYTTYFLNNFFALLLIWQQTNLVVARKQMKSMTKIINVLTKLFFKSDNRIVWFN